MSLLSGRHLFTGIMVSLACAACSSRWAPGIADIDALPTPVLEPSEDRIGCMVGPVPDHIRVSTFYSKYCDAGGIPILSSGEIDDRALQQAYYIASNMLAPIPEVRAELVANRAYVAIVGMSQELTSLPEYSRMDSDYWNERARGLGGFRGKPLTSAPEENLLCFRRDRYYGESILVHEFAHTIHLLGLGSRYHGFTSELEDLYESATAQGLWENTYAGTSPEEYWAEGVQSYFDTNLQSNPADGIHNQVDTAAELKDYDPALYEFIAAFFTQFDWKPTCLTGAPQ